MVLCDRCKKCLYPECAATTRGTALHGGPFICKECKEEIVHEGFRDIMEDWPLHDFLWAGQLLEDLDEK